MTDPPSDQDRTNDTRKYIQQYFIKKKILPFDKVGLGYTKDINAYALGALFIWNFKKLGVSLLIEDI